MDVLNGVRVCQRALIIIFLPAFAAGQTGSGPYTVQNQQPVTDVFYPGTIWTTPLPSDVGSHLATNSDAIVSHIFGGSTANNTLNPTILAAASLNFSYPGAAVYYASATDPLYKILSCNHHPSNSSWDPTASPNNYFHMPNKAKWTGNIGDQNLSVWDQSSDIDPHERFISLYVFGHGNQSLTSCSCTTKSCADATPNCQLTIGGYCSYGHPFNDNVAYNEGPSAWVSADSADGVSLTRDAELMQNTINHTLWVNTSCLSPGPVFPAFGDACDCGQPCSNGVPGSDTLRPHNGALFWIDKNYNCGTLPAWQKPICVAMQTYGGYQRDTGGNSPQEGIFLASLENTFAYDLIGAIPPLWKWLEPQATNCTGSECDGANGALRLFPNNTSTDEAYFSFFDMPNLIEGHHLHIIDPCVPLGMAGQPGGCVTRISPPAKPQGLNFK